MLASENPPKVVQLRWQPDEHPSGRVDEQRIDRELQVKDSRG
jgi:hypothetical protein